MLNGLQVFVSPDIPRYVLPEEVVPGVPWPDGFREQINTWARGFFRDTNPIPDGRYLLNGRDVHCNPRTFALLRQNSTYL